MTWRLTCCVLYSQKDNVSLGLAAVTWSVDQEFQNFSGWRRWRWRCSETWYSETPTAQYIIYNIKKGLFGDSRRPAKKRLSSPCPGVSSSPPPPSLEKNHPQPTQKRLPIKTFPSPVPDQGEDSLGSPHLRINCADLTEDSIPETNKWPRVIVIKTTLLKALLTSRGNNDQSFPTPNATRRCPHNGPGPPANPPQSGGQPTHLPHLPRTGVKKPTRRQDSQRSWKSFLFHYTTFAPLSEGRRPSVKPYTEIEF